ncbi:MAG: alpha/beta hydrolase domain-containing protein [Myxococcales bacterium]
MTKIVSRFALGLTMAAFAAEARVTRIVITSVERPTFGGTTFGVNGSVGAYEKIRGVAFGEVDPADPRNGVIMDIGLAPRTVFGTVGYSMDFFLLKPIDLAKGNHKLFMEVNNRGTKLFGPFNLSSGGNNPTTAADAGGAFLMNQGYSLAWNGWDISAPPGGDRLTITVPVARNRDGTTITGPSYEYLVFDNATTRSAPLTYAAATLDQSKATLTVRQHLTDPRVTIDPSGWEFVNERAIRLLPAGTAFQQSAIYEFSFTAKDPLVAGLGFAATRDFVAFLKHAAADDTGTRNPLAGDVTVAHAFTVSQPGRYLNDFLSLGFNEDARGRRVFDGVENWIAAGDGVALNFRFAQPGRTERNRQNHLYPEANFPFAFNRTFDPLTGLTDGRIVRCSETHTCPKFLQVISANEYWVKAGSLVHTDARGRDLPDPEDVRFYLLSGVEHTVGGAAPNSRGICQQFQNTTDPTPALRALFIALDEWVVFGIRPPRSEVPRADGDDKVVFSVPQANGLGVVPQRALGFPNIPGVTYTGVITVRHLFDFGPLFRQGILTINPPAFAGPVYPSFVSRVDEDGNEIAGIRLPPVEAPVATTTGWALRAAAFGGPDGCESAGQIIPFAATKAERRASGDPRKSIEERYEDHEDYVRAVEKAAQKLEKRRLLLPDDVQRYVDAAMASDVLAR